MRLTECTGAPRLLESDVRLEPVAVMGSDDTMPQHHEEGLA
jgi:hypothetical protein